MGRVFYGLVRLEEPARTKGGQFWSGATIGNLIRYRDPKKWREGDAAMGNDDIVPFYARNRTDCRVAVLWDGTFCDPNGLWLHNSDTRQHPCKALDEFLTLGHARIDGKVGRDRRVGRSPMDHEAPCSIWAEVTHRRADDSRYLSWDRRREDE